MLSNKWTFSLKILVMFFAIGLVAMPSAMAEFGVSIGVSSGTDISTADGVQIMSEMPVDVRVKFDKVVNIGTGTGFDESDITVIAYNELGGVETAPTLSAPVAYDSANPDGRNFMVTVSAPGADVTRVLLYMAKHKVELADPRAELDDADKRKADGKSAAASLTIHYVAEDAGAPEVYSIRRANDLLLPLTKDDTSVRVIVTLSEKAKAFTKDHISATEADVAGDPVALDPVPERTASVVLAEASAVPTLRGGTPPVLRGLYDGTDRHGVTYVNNPAALDSDDENQVAGIHNAINDNEAYTDPASAADPPVFTGLPTTAAPDPLVAPMAVPATTLAAVLDNTANNAIPAGITLPVGTDRTVDPGDAPKVQDYATGADFQAAFDFHTARKVMYDAYQAEVERHEAYNAAVEAEKERDDGKLAEYIEINLEDEDSSLIQTGTGRDMMLHPYVVTLTPKFANKNSIVVKVKAFEDQSDPPLKYNPPSTEAQYVEGTDKLTIKVGYEKPKADLTAGFPLEIPKEKRIPNGGYLVLTKHAGDSGIKKPAGSDKDEPKATERTPAQLLYNVVDLGLPNLETFFLNGGTIDLVAPKGVVISEIMWGSDASLSPNNNSQWIEIRNTSGESLLTGDKDYKLIFYGRNETLPALSTVKDRVSTASDAHGYWGDQLIAKGQSGRTGTGEQAAEIAALGTPVPLISMQRAEGATAGTLAADGTDPVNWGMSSPPGINFDATKEGVRHGSPGAAPVAFPTAPPPPVVTPPPPTPPMVDVATAKQIGVTEIMVDTGNDRFPQWIELTNLSSGKVSLKGWELVIDNAIDADVLGKGSAITISTSLDGVVLDVGGGAAGDRTGFGEGQSVLLVAWASRLNSGNFNADRVINLATELDETGRYTLISDLGFKISLIPPQTGPIAEPGDVVGNLDQDWEIPMAEGSRSSLIRREADKDGAALMGTDLKGWRLASATDLIDGPTSYYGSDEDAGTPGYDSGGPLPVELSTFYPARDKTTGQVVIKWETQSELNNAGFFIKRSQQKKGKFVTINATMVPGAGTTSEKQSYTYTDTTAQPNVVYYYQIEDVSLDGQRQTLTRGIRLRGHIGAAGKATTTWGELKAQE